MQALSTYYILRKHMKCGPLGVAITRKSKRKKKGMRFFFFLRSCCVVYRTKFAAYAAWLAWLAYLDDNLCAIRLDGWSLPVCQAGETKKNQKHG